MSIHPKKLNCSGVLPQSLYPTFINLKKRCKNFPKHQSLQKKKMFIWAISSVTSKDWNRRQPKCCQGCARTHRKVKIPKLQRYILSFFSKICSKYDTLLQLLGIHYSSAFYSTLLSFFVLKIISGFK